MRNIFLFSFATVSVMLAACGGGESKPAKDTVAVASPAKFPEPTDSTANGLHPYYPTQANIQGKWIMPHPLDTSAHGHESYIEFLADQSVKVEEYPYLKPVKWALNGNQLILSHESMDSTRPGLINDTMVIEAVSDTSMHYYHLHEPNFLMYLLKKK